MKIYQANAIVKNKNIVKKMVNKAILLLLFEQGAQSMSPSLENAGEQLPHKGPS